jgi:hypothetical protein
MPTIAFKSLKSMRTFGLLSIDELAGMYDAENRLIQALPTIVNAATHLIPEAQTIEHHQIASSGCLRERAKRLGNHRAAVELQEIANEGKAADRTLITLARLRCHERTQGLAANDSASKTGAFPSFRDGWVGRGIEHRGERGNKPRGQSIGPRGRVEEHESRTEYAPSQHTPERGRAVEQQCPRPVPPRDADHALALNSGNLFESTDPLHNTNQQNLCSRLLPSF